MSKPVSDLAIPNFSKLWHDAIGALYREGLAGFTPLEAITVTCIALDSCREEHQSSLPEMLAYQIDFCDLPKYAALASWLSPLGPAAENPEAFARIANYLLGATRKQEEANLDPELRRHLGI